jgi:hypothetical protein
MKDSDFYSSPEGAKYFVSQLSQGHKWTRYIADKLNDKGILCRVEDMKVAQTVEERKDFYNEQDIIFTGMSGCLEVKSQSIKFTQDPSTFPYKTGIVDTALGWSRKNPKPLATVLVCIHNGEALVVPTSTQDTWVKQRKYDRFRKINDTFLMVDSSLLKTFDDLADWLLARQSQKL